MAERGGRVVAVLGYSRCREARLHPICATRLAHAERLADGASAVIFSGSAEADLMRAAWAGPDVDHVCDADARSTAENAANVVAAACALGADELVVVTSRWHRPRARLLLAAAARRHGLPLRIEAAPGRRSFVLLLREVACLLLLPVHLRRARRI
jgi:hypothetical protein